MLVFNMINQNFIEAHFALYLHKINCCLYVGYKLRSYVIYGNASLLVATTIYQAEFEQYLSYIFAYLRREQDYKKYKYVGKESGFWWVYRRNIFCL